MWAGREKRTRRGRHRDNQRGGRLGGGINGRTNHEDAARMPEAGEAPGRDPDSLRRREGPTPKGLQSIRLSERPPALPGASAGRILHHLDVLDANPHCLGSLAGFCCRFDPHRDAGPRVSPASSIPSDNLAARGDQPCRVAVRAVAPYAGMQARILSRRTQARVERSAVPANVKVWYRAGAIFRYKGQDSVVVGWRQNLHTSRRNVG